MGFAKAPRERSARKGGEREMNAISGRHGVDRSVCQATSLSPGRRTGPSRPDAATQGENKNMKTNWKSWGLSALVMALAGTGAWAVGSDPDASNNSDMIRVRITPNADYGVQIDTANLLGGGTGVIDMGALSLGVSTWTVRPATVTILGTVSKNIGSGLGGQELDMAVDMTGAWVLDATPTTDAAGTIDELSVFVMFSAITMSEAPTGTDFGNATALHGVTSEASWHVGGNSGAGKRFEKQGAAHATDMDQMSANDVKHMWMYFRLPPTTSTGADQELTLTLTAGPNI